MEFQPRGVEIKNRNKLVGLTELNLKPFVKEVIVDGKDNLDYLPKDKPIIFVTTHLSNIDVTIAINALGRDYDFKIVQASTHSSLMESPSGFFAYKIAGKDNFFSIKAKKIHGKEQGLFRTEDYNPMIDYLKTGKSIMIAAYYNSDKKFVHNFDQKNVRLPNKGGVGVTYLAQKTGATIVPVAVEIDKKEKRATVHIGGLLNFATIEKINEIDELNKKETHLIFKKMRSQSDFLMKSLAKMLPEENRGNWN